MKDTDGLVLENREILQQAVDLLGDLSDSLYAKVDSPLSVSGVGKHIRHILDFYTAFISGAATGRIDYDARSRIPKLETDRGTAEAKIREIMSALESAPPMEAAVMSKNDDGGHREGPDGFSGSTVGRELQFLASHTVHHFAIVAMILRAEGIRTPMAFGVAPSTLLYWRKATAEEGHR